jgi:hypothetical protein
VKDSIFTYSCHTCYFLPWNFYFTIDILVGGRYFIMVLIFISLMTDDAGNLFICFLIISIFSLEKWIFIFFTVLIGIFLFLLLGCKSSLHILSTRLLSDIWFANIFFYSGLSFQFLECSLMYIFFKKLMKFGLCIFLLFVLLVIAKTLLPNKSSCIFTQMFSPNSFIVLTFTFKYIICFELIFLQCWGLTSLS